MQVSKYYLDRRSLSVTLQSTQQHVEPPTESESIEVGDYIEVRAGEHLGKRGIVEWFPIGGISLWFLCQNYISTGDDEESSVELQRIRVPATMVQRAYIPSTVKYTKEKGYDIRPGDVVRVVRGPEYQTKGVVQSVDFPNACLNLLSDVDRSLVSTIHSIRASLTCARSMFQFDL